MSSNSDEKSKTAKELYDTIIADGDKNKPDYAKFISYAFKHKNEALVNSLLHHGESFDSASKVMKLLESYIERSRTTKLEEELKLVVDVLANPTNSPSHSKKDPSKAKGLPIPM